MGHTRRTITPLRRAIFEAGLTQRALAELTSIDAADISRFVNGLHPSDDRKQRIANALGWQIADLWPESLEEGNE
jgi:transcriptional regulator with XRE-family HTH domain